MRRNLSQLYSDKKKLLLLILLNFFPIINFLTINTYKIKFVSNIFYLFFFCYIAIFFILFVIFFLINKNLSYRFFFIIVLFFNLEIHFYDLEKFFFEDRYISLLFLIILPFLCYELIKKEFFQIFFLLFITISLSYSIIIHKPYELFKNVKLNTVPKELNLIEKRNDQTVNEAPNIFYFILDGLGSINNLKKNGIEVKSISEYLKNNGYKVSLNSRSSYTETSLTLSSIFNLDYIADGKEKFYTETLRDGLAYNYDYYPFFSDYQKIPLVDELEKMNYKFFKIENSYAKCNNHIKIKCFKIFEDEIFFPILNDYSLEVFFSKSLIYSTIRNQMDKKIVDNYDTIQHFKNIFFNYLDELNYGGNFTLIHHMSPHRPMRDENCKILEYPEKNLFTYKNYKSSVKCVFKRIKEINEIILKSYPNSIIVFQGDHGPIFEEDKGQEGSSKKPNMKLINNRITNFNAMLIPGKCEKKFYDEIGNVETIRLILNCIGADKIEPRKKSNTFIFYPNEKPRIYNVNDL